ncbi:MAG: hypothetical protein Q9Q40_03225 [Acidobacteriota bacterium]|nr:hypothetical protein [Acidobacteriota bacterium]MDQ7086765.1 hypothetical protein [Acidobacteriota bacterium]
MNPACDSRGQTLVAVIVAAAGAALLLGAGARLMPLARGRSVEAAARALGARIRAEAVAARSDGRTRGLIFPVDADEPLRWATDGNGNGLRRREIADGVDPAGPPFRVGRDHPGVRVGRPGWAGVPDLPPSSRVLGPDDPSVRFGASRMASFTALGRATPGSFFLTDGRSGLCALRLSGPTARLSVWCFDRKAARWRRR